MLDKAVKLISNRQSAIATPILRYVIGSCFIVAVSSLMDYSLSYLTAVLGLGYLAPGVRPLTFKQSSSFLIALIIITFVAFVFSAIFLDYLLIFIPILGLGILYLYYTDKLVGMVKLFAIMSLILIPLLSLTHIVVGAFVSVSLIINAFMAVILAHIIFFVFPWSTQDEHYVKTKEDGPAPNEQQRFTYATNILVILFPVVMLFYFFNMVESVLVLIFIAILCTNPNIANAKIGFIFVAANIVGGLFAIAAYQLLTIVPMYVFMLLIVLAVGFFFAPRLFSSSKLAPVFGSAYSTFLLILGNVTSSDSDAGSTLWSRVFLISLAVIYVVVAFAILNHYQSSKKRTDD